jgi:UDP-glucose:tetrahydrobiopterin glucosyltransferase
VRVAVVAPLVAPLLERSAHGNLQVLLDVAVGLQDRGHEVAVFCASGSDVRGVRLETTAVEPDRWELGMPESEPVKQENGAEAAVRQALDRQFEAIRAFRPDAVSQHAFDARAISAASEFNTVTTLHLPPIEPDVVAACKEALQIFAAVSHDAQRRWAEAGLDVELLRNGVPDPLDDGELPTRSELDRSAIVAGRICPAKGTAVGVRAAFRAGLKADVVGTVDDRDYYETEVEPLLRTGYASFCGAVSRRELADLLLHAEVALMPVDWDEPFGLVAAEAQMVGCPVVAYNRGALPEIVEHGFSGWIVPAGDESALVGAAAAASSLPRREIRASARQRLGLAAMIDGYERLLERARDETPASRRPAEGRTIATEHGPHRVRV